MPRINAPDQCPDNKVFNARSNTPDQCPGSIYSMPGEQYINNFNQFQSISINIIPAQLSPIAQCTIYTL